jgi:phenylalanyl-tRNA synthetase beta chain
MALLAHLLETECNARVSVDMIDTAPEAADAERMRIGFSLAHTNALLGTELSRQEVAEILGRLDISVEESENGLIAAVPPERLDLQIAQDIIEEIGRLYGYANIPEQPIEEGFPMPVPNSVKQAWYRAGDALVQLGFYEVYNRSLVSNGSVQLANALNSEAGTLRSQLLDGVLARVDKNFTHTDEPKLFEIGKVFTGVAGGVVQEHWSFAGVLGRRKIKDKHKQDVFLQTKGALETAFEAMSVRGIIWEATDSDDVVATLMHNGHTIGQVGVNHWEINFEKLVAAIDNSVSYQAPSRYPTIDRDVAVWVPLDTPVQAVADLIASAGAEKCIDTSLFDVYEDADNSRKSVGFRLVFQCWEQTLSDEFANQQMEKIYNILKTQDGFEIR